MDNRYDYRDGQFVSQRIANVVQAIHDYCPEIEVQWIPEGQRLKGDSAFRLIHHQADGSEYVIRYVKTEEEFDARILMELILGDQRNGRVSVSSIEAAEEAAKRVAHQRWLDEMEEAHEKAHAVMKSNKSTYKISDDLIIKDYLPGNHATRKKYF